MNWLELDRARAGNPTARRLRKKSPDPRIGDHLPPPPPTTVTTRSQEVGEQRREATHATYTNNNNAGAPGGGVGQDGGVQQRGEESFQTAKSARLEVNALLPMPSPSYGHASSSSGSTSVSVGVGGSPDRGHHIVDHVGRPLVRLDESGSRILAPSPLHNSSPQYQYIEGFRGGAASSSSPLDMMNSTARFGNGRLTSVIDNMRTLTVRHELRVSGLRVTAAEAALAHGDSLDVLLQAFAGVAPRASPKRVDDGESVVMSGLHGRGGAQIAHTSHSSHISLRQPLSLVTSTESIGRPFDNHTNGRALEYGTYGLGLGFGQRRGNNLSSPPPQEVGGEGLNGRDGVRGAYIYEGTRQYTHVPLSDVHMRDGDDNNPRKALVDFSSTMAHTTEVVRSNHT